jgi:hypothetical protein
VRRQTNKTNEPSAVPGLKLRMTQAVEAQSALSANPMEKWIEGLRSTFEPESGKKIRVARFRPA